MGKVPSKAANLYPPLETVTAWPHRASCDLTNFNTVGLGIASICSPGASQWYAGLSMDSTCGSRGGRCSAFWAYHFNESVLGKKVMLIWHCQTHFSRICKSHEFVDLHFSPFYWEICYPSDLSDFLQAPQFPLEGWGILRNCSTQIWCLPPTCFFPCNFINRENHSWTRHGILILTPPLWSFGRMFKLSKSFE